MLAWATLALALALAFVLLLVTLWPLSRLGSEFMPPLNEGDLLYMPSTLPDVSAREAARLLQQTDRLIKSVPEVDMVFGKAGRAQSATDPAPLTMLETTIRFNPRDRRRPGMTEEKLIEELDKIVSLQVTIMIIFILLFITFKRVSDVLLIMGTLPFSLIGGVWLLWLLGYNLSVAGAVGFIALTGWRQSSALLCCSISTRHGININNPKMSREIAR